MALTIGQVSSLLNLSPETIRYYESEGIVTPKRKKDSSYRTYEIWDLFDLLECLKYRNMDFPVKEARSMMKQYDLNRIEQSFSNHIRKLNEEITLKQILLQSVEDYNEKIKNAKLNIGNYWFRTEEEKICMRCTVRRNGVYEDFDYKNKALIQWIRENPFMMTYLEISWDDYLNHRDAEDWFCVVRKNHFERLKLPADETKTIEAGLYLHTMIDIGEKGHMSVNLLHPVIDHIREKGLFIEGNILGELLIRFYENGEWHRLVEVMVPVRTARQNS